MSYSSTTVVKHRKQCGNVRVDRARRRNAFTGARAALASDKLHFLGTHLSIVRKKKKSFVTKITAWKLIYH